MKIGLALSGDGVLGVAHLGVLEEIEKANLKIRDICGASSGAIIGALFADGGVKRVSSFLADLQDSGLLSSRSLLFHPSPDRIFEEIKELLEKNLQAKKFFELPINFSCVATDIKEGKMTVLSEDLIVDAVMASAAYPGVFPVQKIKDEYLIDGGASLNLPARVLKEKGSDFIIGSSLYSVAKMESSNKDGNIKIGRIENTIRALDIMQKEMAENEMKSCDFCFNPPVESFRWYNFEKMDEIRRVGEEYASKEFPTFLKLLGKKSKPSFWQRVFH